MDSVLRPRDIQARIRSGESPETVAAAAQTSVDKIMGFATPVLAERAYVAEQALKASVRRRAGDGPIGHLGEAVEQRLTTPDGGAVGVEWDAWRREDGRWTLVAEYPSSGVVTRAQFVYDQAGRYVMAEDDEARWLVGERGTSTAPVDTAPEATSPVETPAPAAPEPQAAGQLPLGDDAIELVTGLRPAAEPPATDDWITTQASERTRPAPARVAEEPPETLFDTPPPDEQPDDPSPEVAEVVEPEQAGDTPAADAPAKPRKSSKSKRASVPSWDEIMFGSGKGE
jgi:Protein of unknown function (DUF3071)